MIEFDNHGYIKPYEIIEISLADFEKNFVSGMPDQERRNQIFQVYLEYLSELFEVVGRDFFQLINGSFTTQQELPKDIDVVKFLHYRNYNDKFEEVEKLTKKWQEKTETDIYIAAFSAPGHPYFIHCQLLFERWKTLFSYSRESENGKRFPKGLIKIQFNG